MSRRIVKAHIVQWVLKLECEVCRSSQTLFISRCPSVKTLRDAKKNVPSDFWNEWYIGAGHEVCLGCARAGIEILKKKGSPGGGLFWSMRYGAQWALKHKGEVRAWEKDRRREMAKHRVV